MRSAEILENRRLSYVFEGFSLPTWLPKLLQNTSKMASENAPRKRSKNKPSKYLKMDPRMPPKTPQEGPRRPKGASGGPRLRPKRPQDPPKTPQGAPREPQGRPKEPSGSPQDPPRRPPRSDFLPGPPQEADLGSIWGCFGVILVTFLIRFGAEVGSKLSQHVCNFEVLLVNKYVKVMFFKPWGHAGYGYDLFHWHCIHFAHMTTCIQRTCPAGFKAELNQLPG